MGSVVSSVIMLNSKASLSGHIDEPHNLNIISPIGRDEPLHGFFWDLGYSTEMEVVRPPYRDVVRRVEVYRRREGTEVSDPYALATAAR